MGLVSFGSRPPHGFALRFVTMYVVPVGVRNCQHPYLLQKYKWEGKGRRDNRTNNLVTGQYLGESRFGVFVTDCTQGWGDSTCFRSHSLDWC